MPSRIHLPAAVGRRVPAIVMLPAISGLNAYIYQRVERLNAAGYAVSIVDYYRGFGAPDLSTPQKIQDAVANLQDGEVLASVGKAMEDLGKETAVDTSRIGVLGFCIGGTYAMLAASCTEGIAAAVNYYGTIRYETLSPNKPVSPLDAVKTLSAPLIAHYGTTDLFVPLKDVVSLEDSLTVSGRLYELFRYHGAPHAFDEDFRQAFRPVSAHEAWARTMTFLKWYLRSNDEASVA